MNNAAARMNFDNAKRAIDNINGAGSWKQYKLTQSYLRLEVALAANASQFTFNVLTNQPPPNGVIFNTEQRMNLQDTFIPNEIGFFLGLPTGVNDATYLLRTFPNPFVFANAANYGTLYNSKLQIAVNNNILIPAWDMQRHWVTNQTQQVAAPPAITDQRNGMNDGLYPFEPNVALIGSKNTVITLQLPAIMAAVDANVRAILYFRGVLAQNSTVVS
jgi:hypothetical protein